MGRASGDSSDPDEARIVSDKREEVLSSLGKRITLRARATEGK